MIFKPPFSAQVNWSHPLSKGLVGVFLFNEKTGEPRNLVSNAGASLLNGAIWTPQGIECKTDSSSIRTDIGGYEYIRDKQSTFIFGYQQTVPLASFAYFMQSGAYTEFSFYWDAAGQQWASRGTISFTMGGLSAFDYRPHVVTFRIDDLNKEYRTYVDGRLSGSSTTNPIYSPDPFLDLIHIGGRYDYSSRYCAGIISFCLAYDRCLSQEEISALNADPYQVFYRDVQVQFEQTLYIMAEEGSFAVTGKNASLELEGDLTAEAGSIAITGAEVSFDETATEGMIPGIDSPMYPSSEGQMIFNGISTAIDPGHVSVLGFSVSLQKASILSAEASSVSVIGKDISFDETTGAGMIWDSQDDVAISSESGMVFDDVEAYSFDVDGGSFAVTGLDSTFRRDIVFPAEWQSFILTGKDTSLYYGIGIAADSGSIALTGGDASLEAFAKFIPESGYVAITGKTASLQKALVLSAEAASFTVTGTDATLTLLHVSGEMVWDEVGPVAPSSEAGMVYEKGSLAYTLDCESSSIAIAGQDISFLKTRTIEANENIFSITGRDASLEKDTIFNAESASFAIAAVDTTLTKEYEIEAAENIVSFLGQDASLEKDTVFAAEAAAFNLTGSDVELKSSLTFSAEAASFTVLAQDTALIKDSTFAAQTDSIVVTGKDAELSYFISYFLSAGSDTVFLTGRDAELRITQRAFQAQGESISLTGDDITLLRSLVFECQASSYLLQGQDISFDWNRSLDADDLSLSIRGRDATFLRDYVSNAETALFGVTGFGVVLDLQVIILPRGVMSVDVVARIPSISVTAKTPNITATATMN